MRKLIVPVIAATLSTLLYSAEYPANSIIREIAFDSGGGQHCEERYIDTRASPVAFINRYEYSDLAFPNVPDRGAKCSLIENDGSLDMVCKIKYERPNGLYDIDGKQVVVPTFFDCKSLSSYSLEDQLSRKAEFDQVKRNFQAVTK